MGPKKKVMLQDLSTKYEVSFLCKLFNFPRSSLYYQEQLRVRCSEHDQIVIDVFTKSRKIYGCRKIRATLLKRGYTLSRRKILEIMRYYRLVPKYSLARKVRGNKSNKGSNWNSYTNLVLRQFNGRKPFEVIAADVTYVYFGKNRYYLCIFVDIATRMIVGTYVDIELGANFVEKALMSMDLDLSKVEIFHTDRGAEFNNHQINQLMETFGVARSLSDVSAPLDNAVVESLNNIIKIEWKHGLQIRSIGEFRESWGEYVHWYNNERIHGSLKYKTPVEFLQTLSNAS
jgi:transposase InsO family protein